MSKIGIGLQIKQSQQMVMTPQLQQSIKILQLSTIDLMPYISQQIEENPFLEKGDDDMSREDDFASDMEENNADHQSDEMENNWSDDTVSPAVYEENTLEYAGANSGGRTDFGDSNYGVEQLCEQEKSLRDHVLDQLNVDIDDPVQKMIAVHLTDLLDENGYLSGDLAAIAETLKCDMAQIESTLEILKTFDPVGIFAAGLAECLALQLKDKDRLDPAMLSMIENLDLLAKCDFKALKKICGVDDEDLAQMCEEIKALNPRPGSGFSTEHVQIIQPDVFLKKDGKTDWIIELNSESLPRVLVNRRYYSQIDRKTEDKASKKFMTEQFSAANWLVKALDQRANTILKVATEIVTLQDSFFRKGIHHLKPLVLSDIAQNIEMHESTVSRVINGKYIATHMGLYELKYFFSSSVGGQNGGEDISSKRIKYMIKGLINKENPKKILSDEKITNMLKEQGIDVARRTVMKYREAMDIPSSVQRRREKKLPTGS